MSDLYAWVVKEADGREGIIATMIPGLSVGLTPLVGANRKTVEMLRPFADLHAHGLGLAVRLVRYAEAETLERL